MDPLSLVALLGVAAIGRQIAVSDRKEGYTSMPDTQRPMPHFHRNINNPGENLSAVTEMLTGPATRGSYSQGKTPLGARKDVIKNMSDVVPNAQNPFGQPVYNLYGRENVSGKMNNLSSTEKRYVGPGIGVPATVPAYGGFHQKMRVMPNNVNAYRLTHLPGRSGPAKDFVSLGTNRMVTTQNRPEKTHVLIGEGGLRPLEQGRGQGQGGAMTGMTRREKYIKSQKTTNRSETSYRGDNLSYGTAKSTVSMSTNQENPTRNKASLVSRINDVAGPGDLAAGGYEGTQSALLLRPSQRGNAGYRPPAGRMNVMEGKISQGMVTQNRGSASVEAKGGSGNQGISQNYAVTWRQDNNVYKGNANFHSQNLDVAKRQLDNNPFARSIN